MGDSLEGPMRNVRDDAHLELKMANNVYTDCVSKQFLPAWLKGESLQLNIDVCAAEYGCHFYVCVQGARWIIRKQTTYY